MWIRMQRQLAGLGVHVSPGIGPSAALGFQPNVRAQNRCREGRDLKAHRGSAAPQPSATQEFESRELH